MTILQAIVLGIVQGLTEFLPVSSSGHLVLFPAFLGWDLQDVAFDAVVHLATLLVIVMVFWKDLWGLVKHPKPAGWMIVFATIPVGLFGLWIESFDAALRTLPVVGASLAVWGVLLILADRYADRLDVSRRTTTLEKVGWKRVLAVGCAQAIALIPGSSRSGTTVTFGLWMGLERTVATRLAFLVGVPAIAAAGLKKVLDVASGQVDVSLLPLVVGFVSAFVSGYVAVRWLLKLLERQGFFWFGVYRIVLAGVVFVLWVWR